MKTFTEKLIFSIFAIIGLVIIVAGIFSIDSEAEFKKTAIKTTATITHIDRHYDSDGDTRYTVYVEFEVNGKKYSGTIGHYSSGMHVGGSTDVYYNPIDPSDFRSSLSGSAGMIIVGLVFFLVGGGMILKGILTKNKNNKLMETGRRIFAEFVRVDVNTSYHVNGRHPYRVICQGTGNDYNEYVSENIWKNPERFIQDSGIRNFSVYIDDENPKKYYMSLEEISEFLN